jgi:hypothetical protein
MKDYLFAVSVFVLTLFSCEHELPKKLIKVEGLVYTNTNISIDSGSVYSSSLPSYVSESNVVFEITTIPDSKGNIEINNEGKISTKSELDKGNYQINVKTTNSAGTSLFTNALNITVIKKTAKITFQNNILPLVTQKCTPCHTSGSESFKIYENAKIRVDEYIRRTQLESTEEDFMPNGKTPLSSTEIELFKQWKLDGLLN